MRRCQWSYYEESEAMKFVHSRIDKFAKGMDISECESIAWISYFEVRKKYENDLSNTDFWLHASQKIKESINEARRVRNERIAFESPLSLNAQVGENKEEMLSILPSKQGDFTNSVDFWLYAKSLGGLKYYIIMFLTQQEDDYDIMTRLHISREEYYTQKIEIREELLKYFRIDKDSLMQ